MRNEESILQEACVEWFRLQYPKMEKLLISIPNGAILAGTPKQRAILGKRLKDEGLTPGASDLFLFIPSGELHGLGIEMKTKNGRQSESQMEFEQAIIEQGYGYVMPRTLEQFQAAVRMYLESGEY